MSFLRNPRVLLTSAVVIVLMVASAIFIKIPLPHIQLPPEPVFVLPGINFPVTNTLLAMLVADAILIGLALRARSQIADVPRGVYHLFEMIIAYWRDLSIQLVGEERTRRWLPIVLTMFFLVITANWLELIPGVDSVGLTCHSGDCPGEREGLVPADAKHTYFVFENVAGIPMAISRVDDAKSEGATPDENAEQPPVDSAAAEGHDEGVVAGEHAARPDNERVLIPFFRVTASDLNFTLALALIAFTVIEIAGFSALGIGYLGKFFSFASPLAFFVGLVELLSEVARIISFSFRLFGNLFAGQVLLFIMPFLVPFLLVLPFYGLEIFVGAIQGFVFAMLTLVFMSIAIESHADPH